MLFVCRDSSRLKEGLFFPSIFCHLKCDLCRLFLALFLRDACLKSRNFWVWAKFATKNGDHFFGLVISKSPQTTFSEFHAGNATKIGISRGEVPSNNFGPGTIKNRCFVGLIL